MLHVGGADVHLTSSAERTGEDLVMVGLIERMQSMKEYRSVIETCRPSSLPMTARLMWKNARKPHVLHCYSTSRGFYLMRTFVFSFHLRSVHLLSQNEPLLALSSAQHWRSIEGITAFQLFVDL
uniref:Uncharacterized protein n=1 Tax=Rhipicephalus appendiculatus TaxID=34631 RepID=A0A131YF79_RHIAP